MGRFFVENMRADEAKLVFGLRINVIVSVVLFVVALRNAQLVAVFHGLADGGQVGEIDLRIDALRQHISKKKKKENGG